MTKKQSKNTNHRFDEYQRDAVCKGKLCPKCLGENIELTGAAPDGMNMNYRYQCKSCKEGWEGY